MADDMLIPLCQDLIMTFTTCRERKVVKRAFVIAHNASPTKANARHTFCCEANTVFCCIQVRFERSNNTLGNTGRYSVSILSDIEKGSAWGSGLGWG